MAKRTWERLDKAGIKKMVNDEWEHGIKRSYKGLEHGLKDGSEEYSKTNSKINSKASSKSSSKGGSQDNSQDKFAVALPVSWSANRPLRLRLSNKFDDPEHGIKNGQAVFSRCV